MDTRTCITIERLRYSSNRIDIERVRTCYGLMWLSGKRLWESRYNPLFNLPVATTLLVQRLCKIHLLGRKMTKIWDCWAKALTESKLYLKSEMYKTLYKVNDECKHMLPEYLTFFNDSSDKITGLDVSSLYIFLK